MALPAPQSAVTFLGPSIKRSGPMIRTESGTVIFFSAVQPSNTASPSSLTPSGTVNETSDAETFVADAALSALDEVDRVEDVLSVFRARSKVSRINALASEMNIRVDDELWGWLETSLRLGRETDGAFDVAAAPLWQAWGFAKRDGEFPEPDKLRDALEKSGARHLRLDPVERTIAFDEPGVALNFGAIGKGFALDAAAKIMEERGVGSFLIQGGKSGVITRGGRKNDYAPSTPRPKSLSGNERAERDDEFDEESGLPVRGRATRSDASAALDALLPDFNVDDVTTPPEGAPVGWTIGVAHPLKPERRLAELWLRDRALATSGSTWQFFRSGGKRYSHIIDPRTGYPTFGVLSATVLASTATEADALSTAFFVSGAEKTREFCERRPDVSALHVLESERSPGYELATFNLDSGTLRICGQT